jgi:hypothetical protein
MQGDAAAVHPLQYETYTICLHPTSISNFLRLGVIGTNPHPTTPYLLAFASGSSTQVCLQGALNET